MAVRGPRRQVVERGDAAAEVGAFEERRPYRVAILETTDAYAVDVAILAGLET